MARAKRTERAEARRRYREAAAAMPDTTEVEAPAADQRTPQARKPGRRADASSSPARPARGGPGFFGGLRAAWAPVDLRGDLRALPSLLVSRASWIPALVILGATVLMLLPAAESNSMIAMAVSVILAPPPMIIAFLAGMLATRAAWLLGGIMSLLASVAYLVVYFSRTDVSITTLGFPVTILPADKLAVGLAAIPTSLLSWAVFGIAIGAFAGFYRRFLRMSVPTEQASRKR